MLVSKLSPLGAEQLHLLVVTILPVCFGKGNWGWAPALGTAAKGKERWQQELCHCHQRGRHKLQEVMLVTNQTYWLTAARVTSICQRSHKSIFTHKEGDPTGWVCSHPWAAELGPLMKILDLTLDQTARWPWSACRVWSTHHQACNMTIKGIIYLELPFSRTSLGFFLTVWRRFWGQKEKGRRSGVLHMRHRSLSHVAQLVRQRL